MSKLKLHTCVLKKKTYHTNFKKEGGSFEFVYITTNYFDTIFCVFYINNIFSVKLYDYKKLRRATGPFFQDQEI